jgi:hypothetical protein
MHTFSIHKKLLHHFYGIYEYSCDTSLAELKNQFLMLYFYFSMKFTAIISRSCGSLIKDISIFQSGIKRSKT